jgi:glycosyltransferase involved in cell wall biosynthesis
MHSATAISIVIITRNEAANIGECIRSAQLLSEDIVVVDSGSTDDTVELALSAGARVLRQHWQGYGAARNRGASAARYDWILALDADERIGTDLIETLKNQSLDPACIYRFRRRNHWQQRPIRFGAYGFDRVARLYHRGQAAWNHFAVHERLTGHGFTCTLHGHIDHFGIQNALLFEAKKKHYAWLGAITYAGQGKKASYLKRTLAPLVDAARSYVLLGGFLDGVTGWRLAAATYRYTALKYRLLHQQGSGLLAKAVPEKQLFGTIAPLTTLPSSAAS